MAGNASIRILCVDDHPVFRGGIATLVGSQTDMALVAEAGRGGEAVRAYRDHRPDVTLMDLRLPDMSGIDAMIAILAEFPGARIVMLTTFEGDVEIRRALEVGARGYLLKSMLPGELLDGIRQVHAGGKRIPAEIGAQVAEHLGEERLTVLVAKREGRQTPQARRRGRLLRPPVPRGIGAREAGLPGGPRRHGLRLQRQGHVLEDRRKQRLVNGVLVGIDHPAMMPPAAPWVEPAGRQLAHAVSGAPAARA